MLGPTLQMHTESNSTSKGQAQEPPTIHKSEPSWVSCNELFNHRASLGIEIF